MKTRVFALFCALSLSAAAQQLNIQQATLGQWMDFRPDAFYQMQWRDGERLSAWKDGVLWEASAKKAPDTLLTAEGLAQITGKEFKSVPFSHAWVEPHLLFIQQGLDLWLINLETASVVYTYDLPKEAENIEVHPASGRTAFTMGQNVWIAEKDGSLLGLTDEKKAGVSHGSGYVHRQEFGIKKGLWWSSDGQKLAWYVKDESMVTDYPLVATDRRIAAQKAVKYPMAGMKSEEVSIRIHDLKDGSQRPLDVAGPKEQYLTSVTWGPEGKHMYVGILNRGQDSLSMQVYDAESGKKLRELFTETHTTWVEPEHPLYFIPEKPELFVWQSERDGYNHLYLYNTQGELQSQLTQGDFVVTELYGAFGGEIYYQSTEPDPRDRHVYAVSLKKNKKRKISGVSGWNSAVVSPQGRFLAHSFESAAHPGLFQILSSDGTVRQLLLEAKNPFNDAGIRLPEMEMVELKAGNGTPLYGRLIKPQNMQEGERYPTIVYVYGGPHAQMVTNTWLGGGRLWDYYMAQRGYVVFTLDNRGSADRGKAFEEIIHRQLGKIECRDQMTGVAWLKKQSYVDPTRIGVHGWSFGGFMTTSLMTKYPATFAAGVAGGPVIDWKWYEVMYGERYMDSPQENAKGYAETSLMENAARLENPLLIIHGYQDDVVVPQHALEFVEACIKSGTQVDFFLYPSHAHNVRGKDRVHLMEKITRYFDLHLKGVNGKSFR